jgi:hypothetical protein
VVSVVLLVTPIVGVDVIEVDEEATMVETMARLDLVGSRHLGLVFSRVPMSLGLVGSSILVGFPTLTTTFKMSIVLWLWAFSQVLFPIHLT